MHCTGSLRNTSSLERKAEKEGGFGGERGRGERAYEVVVSSHHGRSITFLVQYAGQDCTLYSINSESYNHAIKISLKKGSFVYFDFINGIHSSRGQKINKIHQIDIINIQGLCSEAEKEHGLSMCFICLDDCLEPS